MQFVPSLIADPGVMSLIPARSHTFVEIDHKIFSAVFPPFADSRRVGVNYKRKYRYKVLVTHPQQSVVRL